MTHKERSLNQFLELYRTHDPEEMSVRCNLPFDGEAFSLRIMGKTFRVPFPGFKLENTEGGEIEDGFENVLFLRFLCEGAYAEPFGKQLSYREVPWGNLYYPNFEGRCIRRLANTFGSNIGGFKKIMEGTAGLKAEKLAQGDAGYRFEFSSGLYMSFLLWAADDEFPPSAQILFDDNFPSAFTAEDMAVVADVAIEKLAGKRQPCLRANSSLKYT